MPDPFASPKHRLTRAKKKLQTLIKRGHAFTAKRPHAFIAEPDHQAGIETYKFKITKSLPLGVRDLAWEIVEETRSSLDQLGYACAVAGGKISPKSTYFPIADSAAQLETDVIGRGRCRDIPPDIVALFRSFQPYKGGNDAVWTLNQFCNGNKHRFVLPAGTVAESGMSVDFLYMPGGGQVLVPTWDSTKNEMAVFTAPIGSE